MTEEVSFPKLKFRLSQPLDIPRCYELEMEAYPLTSAALEKSTLQNMQHHASPFFRCALLKKSEVDKSNDVKVMKEEETTTALLDDSDNSMRPKRKESDDEACHHTTHSHSNELIAYICATRCNEVNLPDAEEGINHTTKHEPSGNYLAVHSIVVEKRYRRLGVAKALLEYFIRSISIYNAELDEAGINRRRNKLKSKKKGTHIDKIVLTCKSSISNLFLLVGFRWRATVLGGLDPIYEMERDVEQAASSFLFDLQTRTLIEPNSCFIVDSFVIPGGENRSGTPVAIVVLEDSPTNTMTKYCINDDISASQMDHIQTTESLREREELIKKRVEAWMQNVASEMNQAVTAFVWPIDNKDNNSQPSLLGMIDPLSDHEEVSESDELESGGLDYCIRFFKKDGEVRSCPHASLAAASVLLREDDTKRFMSFHTRQDVIEARLHQAQQTMTPDCVRIAMDCPWRTVEALLQDHEGHGALLSSLQRFLRVSSDIITFIGVTSDGDDLFVELTSEGYEMMISCCDTVDYSALKHEQVSTKGVIICCEAPDTREIDSSYASALDDDDEEIDYFLQYFQIPSESEGEVSPFFFLVSR